MNTVLCVLVIAAIFALAPVAVSFVVEALRKEPPPPKSLYWNPNILIRYADLDGLRLRYIKTGEGPNLVLLHTLRTELDIFEHMVAELSRKFTVYALDYPGHGFSDIPKARYRPELFVKAVEKFLEKLDIRDATLAGISIGGVIPLLIAAKRNPRVTKVIAVNPYDYGTGAGVGRGNFVAWLIISLARIPVIGDTVMRLRNAMVERKILEGGVADPAAITDGFAEITYASGLRKGHYRAFISLLRNADAWTKVHGEYGKISVPALVIYGDRDWSYVDERRRTISEIPGVKSETVAGAGHFLSLDRPQRLTELITKFAAG